MRVPTTETEPTSSSGGVRRRLYIWLGAVGAVVLVVALVWALGGFDRRASPYMGTRTATGELIETRFWDFRIHRAVVEADRRSIDLDVTVTNKTKDGTWEITQGALLIRLGEGIVLSSNYCTLDVGNSFGPLIPTEATCEFEYEYNEVADPPEGDFTTTVIVVDQIMGESLLTESKPMANNAVAFVEVDVVQLEEEL